MAVDLALLLADLRTESDVVDAMISGLDASQWTMQTPAHGWSIGDQVSHLSYFDDVTVLSATDTERFRSTVDELESHGPDFSGYIAHMHHGLSPAERLRWFRASRSELHETLAHLDPLTRLPWFGPPMSVASSVTARLMENWAHGHDIADTLGTSHQATMRLRHIAHLGVRTFGFGFEVHGLEVPTAPVRVELVAPDGGIWAWGDSDGHDVVSGSALEFCQVVTQRRHFSDTQLTVRGPVATQWLMVAQAFAGPPGPGRAPRPVGPLQADNRGEPG